MTEQEKIVRSLLKTKGSYCDADCGGSYTYNKNLNCPVYIKYYVENTEGWQCRNTSDRKVFEAACEWFINEYGYESLVEELL
jgi:hypothetical protein